jgi:hypothetical protein
MKPVILNLALFPPVEYMALLLFHPEVQIEAHEHYQKQTYRNRYYILGPNGKQLLHVPVDKRGIHHCPIRDAAISNALPWHQNHIRSIETAYNSSPWFLYYRDDFERVLSRRHSLLWDLCIDSMVTCARLAGKAVNPALTDGYMARIPAANDFRDRIHPKRNLLASAGRFNPPVYQQVFDQKHGFVPGLSILDLLCNEGPATLGYLEALYHNLKEML